jgi:ABC-type Fe3+ transport system permease subunit
MKHLRWVAVLGVVGLLMALGVPANGPEPPARSDSAAAIEAPLIASAAMHSMPIARSATFLAAVVVAMVVVSGARQRVRAIHVAARRRRISDVGEDWRALLLGAPPIQA